MTAMIERVAEAIRLAGEGCQSGAVYVDPQAAASAALEAMRMATGDGPNTSTRVYQAMIDAALEENRT